MSAAVEGADESYKLSYHLSAHENDVRAVCVVDDNLICTASRDKTVIVWVRTDSGWEIRNILQGHEHYVSLVSVVPRGCSLLEKGGLLSAGHDAVIHLWDIAGADSGEDPSPAHTLRGHTSTISAACFLSDGSVVSASWDKSLRVWRGPSGHCEAVLEGHEAAVWALAPISDGRSFVSASADLSLKFWRDRRCIRTVSRAHTEPVRALTALPPYGVLSAGNDSAIKLWSEEGELLKEMFGHSSFVYSLAALPPGGTGAFASASEDRTLKVWDMDGRVLSSNLHPATVWCVAALPNGDLLTGGSDNSARVWSQDVSRIAEESELVRFQNEVEGVAIPSKAIGPLNTESMLGPEALESAGTTEGQTRMIRRGDTVEVYQWSNASASWGKLGDVVHAVKEQQGTKLNGKTYDYVFDVDLDEGFMRKLGHNVADNPYSSAQRFLWDNELPQDYLSQVAEFILKNTSAFELGQANRTGRNLEHTPPYATSTPGEVDVPIMPHPGTVSGGGHEVGVDTTGFAGDEQVEYSHFPISSYAVFDDTSIIPKLIPKLDSFNGKVPAVMALTEEEVDLLCDGLLRTLSATTSYHVSKIEEAHVQTNSLSFFHQPLRKVILWPPAQRFLGLDILRLLLLHPSGPAFLTSSSTELDLPLVLEQSFGAGTDLPCHLTGLMLLANAFHRASPLRDQMREFAPLILELTASLCSHKKVSVRMRVLAMLQNFAVILRSEDLKLQVLAGLADVMESARSSGHAAAMKCIPVLGTLAYGDPVVKGLVADLGIHVLLRKQAALGFEPAKEVLRCLGAS